MNYFFLVFLTSSLSFLLLILSLILSPYLFSSFVSEIPRYRSFYLDSVSPFLFVFSILFLFLLSNLTLCNDCIISYLLYVKRFGLCILVVRIFAILFLLVIFPLFSSFFNLSFYFFIHIFLRLLVIIYFYFLYFFIHFLVIISKR